VTPFWHELVTRKSWEVLTGLRPRYRFTLIGGWAVFLYARTLKSKDIDLVMDYDELGRFQKEYPLTKNERLRKYEARVEEVEIDVYAPHYSNPGLRAEEVLRHSSSLEGFEVPRPEILLILKQHALSQRAASPKGEKDRLDILSLLKAAAMDWEFYREQAQRQRPDSVQELRDLLAGVREAAELGINRHELSRLKKAWREALG